MVERYSDTVEVRGSSPFASTTFIINLKQKSIMENDLGIVIHSVNERQKYEVNMVFALKDGETIESISDKLLNQLFEEFIISNIFSDNEESQYNPAGLFYSYHKEDKILTKRFLEDLYYFGTPQICCNPSGYKTLIFILGSNMVKKLNLKVIESAKYRDPFVIIGDLSKITVKISQEYPLEKIWADEHIVKYSGKWWCDWDYNNAKLFLYLFE